MALNIKNEKVEQLAEELAHITGESKTAAILHALEERRERVVRSGPSGSRRMAQVLDFLENEIWSSIPRKLLGRAVTKKEREAILGYGRGGV
jgi:antitoxin VapB